ncbi:hypothetical protein ABBQ32_000791 [Trebouxia sp. C0010 RCD-2024]
MARFCGESTAASRSDALPSPGAKVPVIGSCYWQRLAGRATAFVGLFWGASKAAHLRLVWLVELRVVSAMYQPGI